MSKYELNSSTLSFLQFDDPNDIFKDTISNNPRKWAPQLSDEKYCSLVKTKRISKPYSLKLYSYKDHDEYISGQDHPVYNEGGIKYIYPDTGMFESSFTLDFWCYNIKETSVIVTYKLADPNLMTDKTNNLDSPYGYTLLEMGKKCEVKAQSYNINKLPISDSESHKYNHIAITFDAKTQKISFFYNGKLFINDTNPDYFTKYLEGISNTYKNYKYYFGFHIFAPIYFSSNNSATSYIDNLRVSNKVLWDKDFDPPGVDSKQLFYNNGNVYGVINGASQLLSSNWDLLTDDQKISIINSLDYDILPSPEEMTKFIDDDSFSDIDSKVYSFQKEMGTKNFVIEEKDNKRSELVLPKKLIYI